MITNDVDGVIIRSGIKTEQSFRIKASAKAFKILSSALYSNKIRAIVRELSANAYDAHKEAGNLQTPFDIILPNNLNPNFKIRDYGTGISPENIKTVYTTYFESPKSNSNDYIGCMGLGSKTPLCYTDSFLVTSFYNGKKYVYSIFLNETGCPTFTLFSEEVSTEHNGLEVSFSVDTKDFSVFGAEVEYTLRYYNPLPNISGQPNITLKPVAYTHKGSNWSVREPNKTSVTGIQAIMGNIAYPITNSSVSYFTNTNIDIFFDIGSFEVTASREDISYEPDTIRVLQNRINDVKREIQHSINNQMKQADSYWKAVQVYATLVSTYKHTNILQHISTQWNNESIRSSNIEFYPTTDIKAMYETLNFRKSCYASYGPGRRITHASAISLEDKCIFVLCDETYAINKRVFQAEKDNPNHQIILFDDSNNLWEAYRKEIGMPDTIPTRKLSEFTYEKTKAVSDQRYFKSVLEYLYANSSRNADSWKVPIDFDFSQGGIYVAIDRYMVGDKSSREYIVEHFELLKAHKIDTTKLIIYGVKEKAKDEFVADANWIELAEYCKLQLEAKFTKENMLVLSLIAAAGKHFVSSYNTLSSIKTEFQDYQLYDFIPSITILPENTWGNYWQRESIKKFSSEMYKTDIIALQKQLSDCEQYIITHCPLWSTCDRTNITEHVKQYLKTFLPKK